MKTKSSEIMKIKTNFFMIPSRKRIKKTQNYKEIRIKNKIRSTDQQIAEIKEKVRAKRFPCVDSITGYMWSQQSPMDMNWGQANNYCENLNQGGYSDWHLPNYNLLKTLNERIF